MPKFRVYWVERYVAEVEAETPEEARLMADCSNSSYLGVEEEGIEEVADAEVQSRLD